ncbi:Ctr copper transporter family-domain-containing protein [Lineolata rhizophorae]|uniref:Copper transport protein n=1 Tax=Lineolata rhizophorae TaxID=578093 RepID=A0A6A6PE32_9PEZI|nr:Ctr copper transporter family-domain-containing protein [Lineolata rhizophorae]
MSGMSGMSTMPTGTMAMSSGMSMTTGTMSGMAASSTAMNMGGHSMGNSCKISMLWNWNTIDACFLSKSWHITSSGMFAGSCIGVILLVMVLELLRRLGKEYDRFIIHQHMAKYPSAAAPCGGVSRASTDGSGNGPKDPTAEVGPSAARMPTPKAFRPNLLQQIIRALLHMLQFAVAYFVMLLAMYYNGYIIICIFIGAFLGSFVFSWQSINLG